MRRISQLFLFVCIVFSLQAQNATFSGKVILQGAYDLNTSLMRTALVQQGGLPLLQPYNLAPWYHNGTEVLISTQAGMVDWILVDLRTSPDTTIARKAAILYADGTIRDANGDSILHFNVPAGQYYLAIMHRSHLSTMTATKHAFQNGAILDFVDTTLQVYGTCMIGLGSEKRGMIGGDVNQDRILKYSGSGNDRSPILQRILSVVGGSAINATTTGYYTEDLRMDGTVKYSGSGNDPSLIIQNLITLTGSNAINSTFTGAVPHALNLDPNCAPQPDQANAGPDSLNIPSTSITLQANEPVNGTGLWSILSGSGGSFVDSSVNNTLFTGQVGSAYTLVWTISNACGSSSDTVVIAFVVTSSYPTGYVHCNPANPTAIVDVTNPVTGRTWMDRNLGASQAATSATDANAYGDLYQWGRFADGHQCRNSATTTTLSTTNQPGHGSFILAPNSPYDWRSPQNTNLWQGVNGVNNPCPAGYRLPTEAELNAERLSWSSNNSAGAYGSPLKLPLAGLRNLSDGSLYYVGSFGFYWSSTVSGSNSRYLLFSSSLAFMDSYTRALGFSVRCTKDY